LDQESTPVIEVTSWRGPVRDHLVFFAEPDEIKALATRRRPNDIFRVVHTLGTIDVPGARYVRESGTFCLDLRAQLDDLYRGMDAKSCRYEIRRADKLGARLELRRNEMRAESDFLSLYNDFVIRKGHIGKMGMRRYRQYSRVADVIVAYVDGTPIVGHLVVRDPDSARVRLVFSASVRLQDGPLKTLCGPVNRWLHWQELSIYRSESYVTYDFGGAVNPGGRIARFKRGFGGMLEIGQDVIVADSLVRGAFVFFDATKRSIRKPVIRPAVRQLMNSRRHLD
jgi:hypothetical protein